MDPQTQPTNTSQPDNLQTPSTPSESPKSNRTVLIVIAIIVVLGILGGVAFAMFSSGKDTSKETTNNSSNENTAPVSDKYQKYSVTDKPSGVAFSVSFYKDAKVEELNGRTYLNSGEKGSMYSIYLGAATGDKIDCGESATTTMTLGGKSTTVCYKSDNTQYAGYATTKSSMVKINLAGQKPISMDEAKTIMESVTFN